MPPTIPLNEAPDSTPVPSTKVKLIAYVDELEGGPPPVSLTILAKPTWRMGRVQTVLVKEYEQYLADYPRFSQYVKRKVLIV